MCSENVGPCLQLFITILSFIATATIADYFDIFFDSTKDDATRIIKGCIIISASILSLILSLIKLCKRSDSVTIDRVYRYHNDTIGKDNPANNDGIGLETQLEQKVKEAQDTLKKYTAYMTSYKAIIVQLVDSTFDSMVAISLFINLDYGEGQSLLLVLTSFIGFGEEFIELVFEVIFGIAECCAEECIPCITCLVMIECFGCILELSFGIYLGAQIADLQSGYEFFVAVIVIFSVLICCIICACGYFGMKIYGDGMRNKTALKDRKQQKDWAARGVKL